MFEQGNLWIMQGRGPRLADFYNLDDVTTTQFVQFQSETVTFGY